MTYVHCTEQENNLLQGNLFTHLGLKEIKAWSYGIGPKIILLSKDHNIKVVCNVQKWVNFIGAILLGILIGFKGTSKKEIQALMQD